VLFALVLVLGLLLPRLWCKYVCPTGAVFSLSNLFRMTERKVRQTCVACGKCVKVCPAHRVRRAMGSYGVEERRRFVYH
jgi:polyferredoxin